MGFERPDRQLIYASDASGKGNCKGLKTAFYYELILVAYILRADEYYTFYLDRNKVAFLYPRRSPPLGHPGPQSHTLWLGPNVDGSVLQLTKSELRSWRQRS